MTRTCVSRQLLCYCAVFACHLQAQPATSGQTLWKGKSGAYAIEWTTANLKVTRAANSQSIFDAADEAKTTWASFVKNSNGEPIEAQFTYTLLSTLGSTLSLEETVDCDCGGAHPTAVKRFLAIDLSRTAANRPAPASLTSLFPESAIFKALMADSIVSKALGAAAQPKSLAELLKALKDDTAEVKDCAYEFSSDPISSFAIYDSKGASALVRIGLPSAAQVCRGQMIQLGLELPAPVTLRPSLLKAKQKRNGLLMANSPRGESNTTSFQFSQK
jgi:hypothetical protein